MFNSNVLIFYNITFIIYSPCWVCNIIHTVKMLARVTTSMTGWKNYSFSVCWTNVFMNSKCFFDPPKMYTSSICPVANLTPVSLFKRLGRMFLLWWIRIFGVCFVDGWIRSRGNGVETMGRRLAGARQGPETSPLQSHRSSMFLSSINVSRVECSVNEYMKYFNYILLQNILRI